MEKRKETGRNKKGETAKTTNVKIGRDELHGNWAELEVNCTAQRKSLERLRHTDSQQHTALYL